MQGIIDRIRFPVIGWVHRIRPQKIRSRTTLPFVLNRRRLLGRGAEIGVQGGLFSEHILRYWKGERLYSIDPWKHFAPETYIEKVDNVEDEKHEAYYQETLTRVARFGKRACVLRATSEEAAAKVDDGSLDFAFIDAQHHCAAVQQDIQLWLPKVARGGVLCGHDWDLDYGPPLFGVKRAVLGFIQASGFKLQITDDQKTWFVTIG
jgi:hypothetical protein